MNCRATARRFTTWFHGASHSAAHLREALYLASILVARLQGFGPSSFVLLISPLWINGSISDFCLRTYLVLLVSQTL